MFWNLTSAESNTSALSGVPGGTKLPLVHVKDYNKSTTTNTASSPPLKPQKQQKIGKNTMWNGCWEGEISKARNQLGFSKNSAWTVPLFSRVMQRYHAIFPNALPSLFRDELSTKCYSNQNQGSVKILFKLEDPFNSKQPRNLSHYN